MQSWKIWYRDPDGFTDLELPRIRKMLSNARSLCVYVRAPYLCLSCWTDCIHFQYSTVYKLVPGEYERCSSKNRRPSDGPQRTTLQSSLNRLQLIWLNVSNLWTLYPKIKNFWGKLIAYFPLIRHGPHRKRSRFLATIRGLLPSRCLATIRGNTQTHTHGQQGDLISLPYFFKIGK
jgi:hypothetical protein